jgi:AAA+ ATPase superfamily predicted ATPase
MKWMVGPRRIGKTYKLAEMVFNDKQDCIVVTFNQMAGKFAIELFKEMADSMELSYNVNHATLEMTVGVSDMKRFKVMFLSYEFLNSKHIRPEVRRLPKYIDNLDNILERIFGNVRYATGTGPNYRWMNQLPEEFLESAKKVMGEVEYNEQMTKEWE